MGAGLGSDKDSANKKIFKRSIAMSEKKSKYLYHLNEVPLIPLNEMVSTRFIFGS